MMSESFENCRLTDGGESALGKKTKKKKTIAKDVLPNINRTQATERAENSVFCPW